MLLPLWLVRAVLALSILVPLRITLRCLALATLVKHPLVPHPHRLALLRHPLLMLHELRLTLCTVAQWLVLFVAPCNQVIHKLTLVLPALCSQRLVPVLHLVVAL